MTTRKAKRAGIHHSLDKAGHIPVTVDETPDGNVYVLDPESYGGNRIALLETGEGVDAVAEVPLPDNSDIRTVSPESTAALAFLGLLASNLGARGITASLSTDNQGVAAVLVRSHRCEADDRNVAELVDEIQQLAVDVERFVGDPDSDGDLPLRAQFGEFAKSPSDGDPVLAPTLDPAQLANLADISESLKEKYLKDK